MHYSTFLAAGASLLSLAAAAPTGTEPLAPRWPCVTEYPTYIGIVDSLNPNAAAVNNLDNQGSGSLGPIAKSSSSVQSELLQFTNIPGGSYGCQLEVSFPASYSITSIGNAQVSVYTVSPAFAVPGATYSNTAGESKTLFGTATFNAGGKAVINSQTCSPTLQYRVEISQDSAGGSVSFVQSHSAGFRLTHNC